MSLGEQIKALDLKSKDGLEKARHILIEYSRDNAISEFENRIKAIESSEEMLGEEVKDIEGLLKAIFEYNIFLEPQSIVAVTPWNEIKDEKREWLIPYWLPANTVTMFTGQGGAGKSWLTLQIISQITGGFLDWASLSVDVSTDANSTAPYNVVLATYEDEPAEIKRRLQALASKMEWIANSLETIKQYFHIVDMRGVGSIWGPGIGNHIYNTGDLLTAGQDLQQICEDKKARLLVIDPLSGAFGGNENDRAVVYDFISCFRKWSDTTKCAILIVGHLPKSTEGKSAGFSGSTAWEAAVRTMWKLSKETRQEGKGNEKTDHHYWTLSQIKTNYAPPQPHLPLIKSVHGWWKKAASEDDAINGYKDYEKMLRSEENINNENSSGVSV